MLDDLRNHDPRPTDEERAWMRTDPFAVARQVAAVAAVAVAIAVSLSLPSVDSPPHVVAATSK